MTRASYVRSPWMTCQWEGQLMRFCVWFKLFNLQINMEKVGSCQHFCVSVLIIYSNILSYCCMLSYNILVTLIVQCSVLVFAGWHASQKQKFNTGRKGAQCFVAIWLLHQVAKLNMRTIVAGFLKILLEKIWEITLTLVFLNFNCFQTILHQTASSLFGGQKKKHWISHILLALVHFLVSDLVVRWLHLLPFP